jgi:flagellar biosynthesis protein FlhF
MQLEKITAPTIADAFKEVKRLLGDDAVILSTRTITTRRWMGLRKREVVEVMAGKGVNVQRRGPAAPDKPVIRKVPPSGPAAYAANSKLSPGVNLPPGKGLLESPAAQSVAMMNVANEITALKSMVTSLVSEVRNRTTPAVPEELFNFYSQLLESEVSEELATDIIRKIQQTARPEQLANALWVRERMVEQIEKLIPMSGAIERKKTTGPHIVALIGPTGVGKTTTIAKLAANLKLREGKKVGLITIDTFRIAAIDQLRKYADLIGIVLTVVNNADEMRAAVDSMTDCEYVLIDTAGRSPTDALKLNELGRFLEAARPDEVHLVLSTTCGQRSAELAMEKFSGVRVDKVIFTKIDEAAQLGMLLSVVRKLNKGLSYVTTGQDVPDDIEVGQARRIAKLIVGEK